MSKYANLTAKDIEKLEKRKNKLVRPNSNAMKNRILQVVMQQSDTEPLVRTHIH